MAVRRRLIKAVFFLSEESREELVSNISDSDLAPGSPTESI